MKVYIINYSNYQFFGTAASFLNEENAKEYYENFRLNNPDWEVTLNILTVKDAEVLPEMEDMQ